MAPNRTAVASQESLERIFTVPEGPDSTLRKIEREISQNLSGFLKENIAAAEKPLSEIEKDFLTAQIPEEPEFVSSYAQDILDKLIAHSVHTSAPSFIGHMTSALPYFILPLSKLMVGLNQNLVKIETSKAFTPLERQVLAMLHHLAYGEDESFYQRWMHSSKAALGTLCSGGTVANVSALWIARNRVLPPSGEFEGIAQDGIAAGMLHHGYRGLAILVSKRGHYSLRKAADTLGIGRKHVYAIETDARHKVDVQAMRAKAIELEAKGIKVMAIAGVAGATETGSVDPLDQLADLAEELGCHFHVDAAWGGATLLSDNYRHLMQGIERADSITIDAHKQMYVPMGAGIVLFKDPTSVAAIEHHADYILRPGSKDLGAHTLEGSRPGMAMLVHACMKVIGRKGYEILIDRSISRAKHFAKLIQSEADFQLISEPELCILTYRFVPGVVQRALQNGDETLRAKLRDLLNRYTANIQKRQREAGKSFVSRTRLTPESYDGESTVVFRVVLANPLTTKQILQDILQEQRKLAESDPLYQPLIDLASQVAAN